MLTLYVQAPFAASRPLSAGAVRATAGFLTPSAAYGVLLNVAGLDSRPADDQQRTAGTVGDLPRFQLALGALVFPTPQSLYQQLHHYPVGTQAGAKYKPLARGHKYHLAPVRRGLLSDLRVYLCVEENPAFEQRVRDGLAGKYNESRYGVPFAGDNNLMIDILREEPIRQPVYWYERVDGLGVGAPRPRTTRLTLTVDRQVMAKTVSALFAPTAEPVLDPPEAAWVTVPA